MTKSSAISGSTVIEISDCIRTLVETGKLKPGHLLPPVRELAETLCVNRNTVAAAYQRLAKAGIAVPNGRHGTTIGAPPRAGEQEGLSAGTPLIDLADGNPNPRWLANVPALLASTPFKPFLYGEDTILPELRECARTLFASDCPIRWELELTHGAVDGIERVAAAHLVPGDKVAVEDPCFLGAINALLMGGMQAVGIPMDEDGMLPASLAAALEQGVRAVLLTPRAHNPTGYGLSARRAQELAQVLTRHPNVLVIVDDHFALLSDTPYHSVIPESTTRWALLRSVSKALGPDLRLAFVACDLETAARLRTRLAPGMNWVSHILQGVVAAGLGCPETRRGVDDARIAYAARRMELHGALREQGINIPLPSGGLNVWIPLAKDPTTVSYDLAKRGWLVRPGGGFDVKTVSRAIRVTVSKLEDGQAERFARDLKTCLA